MLVLKVALHSVWDHRQDWLAVEDSRFEVFAKGVSEALFRYDYLRQRNSVPSAHVQVHAHRDAITYVMARCGASSKRARRRMRDAEEGRRLPQLSDLHLPVGGAIPALP